MDEEDGVDEADKVGEVKMGEDKVDEDKVGKDKQSYPCGFGGCGLGGCLASTGGFGVLESSMRTCGGPKRNQMRLENIFFRLVFSDKYIMKHAIAPHLK